VVVVTGLCHGPGCRQDAKTGTWCSDTCEDAWHGQWRWLYGDSQAEEPVMVLVEEDDEEELTAMLQAAVTVCRPQLHQLAASNSTRAASSIVEEIRAAYIQHLDLPRRGPFKLTRWQRDAALFCADDGTFRWRTDDTVLDLSVCPVELVATVEGSTPYHLKAARIAEICGQSAVYPLVASAESQVAQSA
jgi:hypothetical protein